MLKSWLIYLISLTLALVPVQAQARDWGTVSGWFISSVGETCGMFAQSPSASGSEIVILKRLDGALFVQVKNDKWLRSGGEVTYQVDGRTYNGPFSAKTIDKGYIATFGEGFESELQASAMLTVKRDAVVLDQIPLSGSAAAFGTLRSCLDDLRSAGSAPKIVKSPRPANASSWISDSDYPSGALRDQREGTAGFRVTVGANGRVKDCVITGSSGSADLDGATCSNITKRARFSPAVDTSGKAVDASYSSRVSWKLPQR